MRTYNRKSNLIILFALGLLLQVMTAMSNPGDLSAQTTKTQQDSLKTDTTQSTDTSGVNQLQIDTSGSQIQQDTTQIDTTAAIDSSLIAPVSENTLTNTKLFIYIILSVLGLFLFYFIFVHTLFRTFHKTRSTRQALLLSWNLFFTVTIIWIFIIWGIVAEFWSSSAFMVTMICLFIVSLIMLIGAVKSK